MDGAAEHNSWHRASDEQRQLWHDVLQGARGLVVLGRESMTSSRSGRAARATRTVPKRRYTPSCAAGSVLSSWPLLRGSMTWPFCTRRQVSAFSGVADLRINIAAMPGRSGVQEAEGGDNATRVTVRRAADELGAIGLQPCYVSSALVERGALREGHIRTLILPLSIALSDKEAAEISSFAAAGWNWC